jgi:hypothetical protein
MRNQHSLTSSSLLHPSQTRFLCWRVFLRAWLIATDKKIEPDRELVSDTTPAQLTEMLRHDSVAQVKLDPQPVGFKDHMGMHMCLVEALDSKMQWPETEVVTLNKNLRAYK